MHGLEVIVYRNREQAPDAPRPVTGFTATLSPVAKATTKEK